MSLSQYMASARRVWLCGEVAEIRFSGVPEGCNAYVRTNHGCAGVRRREIVGAMENDVEVIGRDWHDLPMTQVEPGVWAFRFPVTEVGIFECKCFFVRDGRIVWARGDNLRFKAEPADYASGNLLYCAFVRQFGPNCQRMFRDTSEDIGLVRLDGEGYTVIPESGTFRDLAGKLDFIFFELGCRIIQLLPVHPMPVSFGRMGRFGSPFAATDYFNVAQELAVFDPSASAMEQFDELVDAVHARHGRLFLDIPVNHTGWNSRLQTERPDLFVHDEHGRFVSPGAWGVVWADLCKLDYSKDDTIKLMSEVFLFWCRRGVDGFRCDAGYMLPERAWDYIVSKVRLEFPSVVFLLEGLGGPIPVQERLLGVSGLNWAYSELFQNYDRGAIEHYYNAVAPGCRSQGMLLNMAETHDNSRLAAVSHAWSRMRCAVNAMLSDAGLFGITNGVEFFAEEKIDVHLDCGLNWGAEDNQVNFLRRIAGILRMDPCFHAGAEWRFVQYGDGNFLAVSRVDSGGECAILALINLDCSNPVAASWRGAAFNNDEAVDLLSGEKVVLSATGSMELQPGEVKIFSGNLSMPQMLDAGAISCVEPEDVTACRARADALKVWAHFNPGKSFDGDVKELGDAFSASFDGFISGITGRSVGNAVHMRLPEDLHREIMVFPGSVLVISGDKPFHFAIMSHGLTLDAGFSVKMADGGETAVAILPEREPLRPENLAVKFIIYSDGRGEHAEGGLILLPAGRDITFDFSYSRRELFDGAKDVYALLTNNLAGYAQCSADWGVTCSKYDAILAANCNGAIPVDRYVMFSRCRAWMVYRDYSFALDRNCMSGWSSPSQNVAIWHFSVPVGQGMTVKLDIRLEMAYNKNVIRLYFDRPPAEQGNSLPDEQPVKIILRPDLEDRVNHTVTKAYTGPEQRFPWAVQNSDNGLVFAPGERRLRLVMRGGRYVVQPEWQYMVYLPRENYYGLEDHTDMFSPGYFEQRIKGGESACLEAEVSWGDQAMEALVPRWPAYEAKRSGPVPDILRQAMNIYTVKRNALATVIAGYPWFLDWGRDTLICLRGLMAAGRMDDARAIILNFATFEENGTIPNMINGTDVSNRDTADAPLWLIVAVADYVRRSGDAILKERCGSRDLREVINSIVAHYISGTSNGIKMDPESKLIFTPPHYTWMDTNYPMGTPREGYPVEIQALWFAALDFAGVFSGEYRSLAGEVQANFIRLFRRADGMGLSDCLHCSPMVPAGKAVADNAIRPNQLLAVTLKLVTDKSMIYGIIESCESLLVPGAIRSLADAAVKPPQPVYWHGVLLNNPGRPYQGRYAGPEDTSRKASYHNGTAWSWPFPAYVEALLLAGGDGVKTLCRGYLNSAYIAMRSGVPGQLPEVMDGDAPHRWGGCGAQAWSVTEFFRVWSLLDR